MNMSNKSLFLQVVVTNCDETVINLDSKTPVDFFLKIDKARNGHTRRTRLAPD